MAVVKNAMDLMMNRRRAVNFFPRSRTRKKGGVVLVDSSDRVLAGEAAAAAREVKRGNGAV